MIEGIDNLAAAGRERLAKAEAAAKAKVDAWAKDDALAASKGKTQPQMEARRRVMELFCQLHLPRETPDAIRAILDSVDYAFPVTTTNGRVVNMENPKGAGLFGMGRKPSYLMSKAFPPQNPEAPIYVVEYFAVAS
jgi:hypothetical protein